MNVLSDWATAVGAELNIQAAQPDAKMLADVTRSVRRCVAGCAVGETMYLLGVSVGLGMAPAEAARRIDELAGRWRGIDWSD